MFISVWYFNLETDQIESESTSYCILNNENGLNRMVRAHSGVQSLLCFVYKEKYTIYRKSPEPEFLNIQWRLKSRLFQESCLFKGHNVQQGLQWLQFFVLCFKDYYVETVWKNTKLDKMTLHLILY
jgi:hypothetical protein